MNGFIDWFDSDGWRALLVALAHTLWMAPLAAAGVAMALRWVPPNRAELRYGLALVGLFAVFVGGLGSWAIQSYSGDAAPITLADARQARPEATVSPSPESIHAGFTETGKSAEATEFASSTPSPSSFLAAAWSLGAMFMLLRMFLSLAGAEKLRRRARPLEDDFIKGLTVRLRGELRLMRRVALAVSDELVMPAVVGLLRPTLLIPSAILGMSPDVLGAVIAHELTHIRRHDLLINAVQMLIEALLFFNPAVWWLSRVLRIEREACCDAVAARLTDGPTDMVRALAEVATRQKPGAVVPVTAAALHMPGGGLLDRVRRLIQPGYRPNFRLPWYGIIGLLIIAALALTVMKQGADQVVDVAVRVFSPEERIAVIEQVREENRIPTPEDYTGTFILSGRVLAANGEPLEGRVYMQVFHQRLNESFNTFIEVDNQGRFSHEFDYGRVELGAFAPDFAPTFAGPFMPPPGENIENIEMTLDPGFAAPLVLRDEKGNPIAGADVQVWFSAHGVSVNSNRIKLVTDSSGCAVVDHACTQPASLSVEAAGYQPINLKDQAFDAATTLTLTMKVAQPARGIVVDARTGEPVAGAEVRQSCRMTGSSSYSSSGNDGPLLATTDANGGFVLDALSETSIYYMIVFAEGYAPARLMGVRPGNLDLRVEMQPPLHVAGVVLHPELAHNRRDGNYIYFSQSVEVQIGTSQYTNIGNGGEVDVEIEDGVGSFRLDGLWPGKVRLYLAGEHFERTIDVEQSIDDLVLDLKPEPYATRTVIIRLDAPANAPPPTGSVGVRFSSIPGKRRYELPVQVPLKDGVARITIPVPNWIMIENTGMVGYWFNKNTADGIEVDEKDEPFALALKAIPAGAIQGTVDSDWIPEGSFSFSIAQVKRSPLVDENSFPGVEPESGPDGRTFVAGPLPIGGTYLAVVSNGETRVASQPVHLTDERPIVKLNFERPQTTDVTGHVTDAAGRPLADAIVELHMQLRAASHGFANQGQVTAGDGSFLIRSLNPGIDAEYSVRVSKVGYRPERINFTPGRDTELPVVLQPGQILKGRVIDARTGKPVEGMEVYANPQPRDGETWAQRNGIIFQDAESLTDAEGRFRFSTLHDRRYSINVRGVRVVHPPVIVQAGAPELINLPIEPNN